ncbi:MAG: hypothetical protein IIU63_02770, partial [Clostridia bacterium]|nr:hypothetical protein [Clostridia bacterium]
CLAEWIPGTTNYTRAVTQFQRAQAILENEIAAGHYTLSRMGIFYHNGANFSYKGVTFTQADLQAWYDAMWSGFQSELSADITGDGNMESVSFLGLVPIWTKSAGLSYTQDEPAGMFMAASAEYPDIFTASVIGQDWLTNADVASKFPAFDYTVQSGETLKRPETTADVFASDNVHYDQVAYNAVGIDIANNLYRYLYGDNALTNVQIVDPSKVTEVSESVTLAFGEQVLLMPLTEPLTCADLSFKAEGDIEISYPLAIKMIGLGTGKLTVFANGEVVKEITFVCNHTHTYDSVTIPATCTEGGWTVYTCACGDSYEGDFTEATGHSYENGVCTECGETWSGPVITKQPTDVKVKMGEEFCVSVEAVGEGLTYTWYGWEANGTFFQSSITDNTYDTVMTAARAGRRVYCVITDANGNSVTTNTVKIWLVPTYIWEQWTQPVTMVAGTYPTYSGDGYRPAGQVYGGIIYSSTFRDGTDALWNFNHSAYYSAAANPASLLYTVNNAGRVSNEAAWMGSTCNTTALRACGYKYPYTTAEIPISPEFEEKTDHSIQSLAFGDILWVKGHVAGVVGVTRDSDGKIASVKIIEQASYVRVFEITAANWDAYFAGHWTTIYHGDCDESLTAAIEYPENYSIIFERGNNTYVTDTSSMLFYIPLAQKV